MAEFFSEKISGRVADFGCGWGYLSLEAVKASRNIASLTLVDVDFRAIDVAKRNVLSLDEKLDIDTVWTDLTRPNLRLGPYDNILLNPPFHFGVKADPSIGQSVIKNTAKCLSSDGKLYLVANKHLPYESCLKETFREIKALPVSSPRNMVQF